MKTSLLLVSTAS